MGLLGLWLVGRWAKNCVFTFNTQTAVFKTLKSFLCLQHRAERVLTSTRHRSSACTVQSVSTRRRQLRAPVNRVPWIRPQRRMDQLPLLTASVSDMSSAPFAQYRNLRTLLCSQNTDPVTDNATKHESCTLEMVALFRARTLYYIQLINPSFVVCCDEHLHKVTIYLSTMTS